MGKLNKALFSSKKQTYETPQELFNKLNKCFKFDLDVCASHETAKCDSYFTLETDGLIQKWEGNCWMNPPYSREQIKWINKAFEETKNNYCIVVCLIPARPDTKVWQDIIFNYASFICFIKGRLKFEASKHFAPFPSALVIFGDLNEAQKKVLDSLGKLFQVS
ncbi:adenine methyltransferase [Clostridioides difficile]|nr:adenine methyltransferase [Clostridioides difficile]